MSTTEASRRLDVILMAQRAQTELTGIPPAVLLGGAMLVGVWLAGQRNPGVAPHGQTPAAQDRKG